YAKAWNKLEGKVKMNSENWLWSLAGISITGVEGDQYSVKKTTEFLRKKYIKPAISLSVQDENSLAEDLWVQSDCPHCQGILQTIEHFTTECNLSRQIWNIIYSSIPALENISPPSSSKKILQPNSRMEKDMRPAVRWLHVFGVYEIWLYYTQAKWGLSPVPEPAIPFITKNRLKKAIYSLQNGRNNNKEKNNLLKFIKT
ncbi:11772_t:CDS:2, partial [Scutellospora calospora]